MYKTIALTDGDQTPDLQADLFLPAGGSDVPLIIAASGGGWRRGSRSDLGQWGEFFAAQGIAFASVDYRRAATAPAFPQNVNDVAQGARFLAKNAGSYGFDAARIAFLGVSAGAHLTALAMLSDAYGTPPLRGFAGIYGPYDVLHHWQEDIAKSPNRGDNLTERMLGTGPFDAPDIYHQASPIRQITSAKALPIFLSWGQLDPAISPRQSEDFAIALQQAGFPVRRRVFPDAGHFWFSDDDLAVPETHAAKVSGDLLRFFKRIFA